MPARLPNGVTEEDGEGRQEGWPGHGGGAGQLPNCVIGLGGVIWRPAAASATSYSQTVSHAMKFNLGGTIEYASPLGWLGYRFMRCSGTETSPIA